MKKVIIIIWVLALAGCGAVKRRTRVEIPPAYAGAKVATLEELVRLINERYAAVESLSVASLKVEFVSGSIETGYMEEYRSARAYLVAKWPDSIYVNILNPLTSSTVVAMATAGDTFQIWVPAENKYLTGKTEIELEEENPIFNVRPHHLLKGILVERIPDNSLRYRFFLEEEEDSRFKYYVVGVIDIEGTSRAAQLVRKLWIERSTMRLVRQHYYESGELVSAITYDHPSQMNGVLINSHITIERRRENYRMGFELAREGIKVNPSIREGAFEVPTPPGAQVVVVKGKTTDH